MGVHGARRVDEVQELGSASVVNHGDMVDDSCAMHQQQRPGSCHAIPQGEAEGVEDLPLAVEREIEVRPSGHEQVEPLILRLARQAAVSALEEDRPKQVHHAAGAVAIDVATCAEAVAHAAGVQLGSIPEGRQQVVSAHGGEHAAFCGELASVAGARVANLATTRRRVHKVQYSIASSRSHGSLLGAAAACWAATHRRSGNSYAAGTKPQALPRQRGAVREGHAATGQVPARAGLPGPCCAEPLRWRASCLVGV